MWVRLRLPILAIQHLDVHFVPLLWSIKTNGPLAAFRSSKRVGMKSHYIHYEKSHDEELAEH
jgi:hypothetical protein